MKRLSKTHQNTLRAAALAALAFVLAFACTLGVAPVQKAYAAKETPAWTLVGTHAVFFGQNDDRYSEKTFTQTGISYHNMSYFHNYSYDESFTWTAPPASIPLGKEAEFTIEGALNRDNVWFANDSARLDYKNDKSEYNLEMKLLCYDGSKDVSSPDAQEYLAHGFGSFSKESAEAIVNQKTGTVTFPKLYSLDYTFANYSFIGITSPLKDLRVDPDHEHYSYVAQFNKKASDFRDYITMIAAGKTPGQAYDSGKTNYVLAVEVRHGSMFRMAYLYEYSPDAKPVAVTTTTTASNTAGEQDGGGIPWGPIVGGLVVIVGGTLIAKGAGGKKGDDPKKPDPEPAKKKTEKKEEQPAESAFSLVIWKDFGDTLFVGASPQMVGARVEETTPQGAKVDRPDLSAFISIAGSENIRVGGATMKGKYMSAPAEAVERPGEAAYDGDISFTFSGPVGTLTNHMTFKIADQRIAFAEENLTFIAAAGQTLAMPFGIPGLDASTNPSVTFQVAITTIPAPFADVRIEQDKEYPSLWNVVITENGTESKVPAGSMEDYVCEVTATIAGSQKPLTGSFEFYRFTEGLRFSVQHLKAYYTVKEAEFTQSDVNAFGMNAAFAALGAASGMGTAGLGGAATAQVVGLGMGMDEYEAEAAVLPADPKNPIVNLGRANATVSLYTWDEETGAVVNPVPPIDLKAKPGVAPKEGTMTFSFEDVPGSCNLKDKNGADVQKPCETLKFFAFPSKLQTNPVTVVYSIVPTAGLMVPPNRSQAKVTVSCTYEGKTFTAEETVNVLSQPYRQDLEERRGYYEEHDGHMLERLRYIQKKILTSETTVERSLDGETLVVRNTYGDMMPVFHRIDAMLDAYLIEYGLYEPDYQRIESLFQNYTTGAIGSTAAAECAFYGRMIEESDALMMTLSQFNHSWLVIGARIGFAVYTEGASEGLFMAIQAELAGFEALLKSIDKNPDDEMLKHFTVGVTEAGKSALYDYAMGKTIELGFVAAGGAAKLLSAGASKAKAALAQRLSKGFSTAANGAKIEGAAKSVSSQLDDAARAAQDLISRYRGGVEGSAEAIQRDIAYTLGRIEGKIKVGNFAEALKDWSKLTRFQQRSLVIAIQQDKHAMRAFMEMEGTAAMKLRAQFNAVITEMEAKGLHMARVSMADELGISMDKIRVKKTSGNASGDIAAGRKISMDMDATFEVFQNGKWVDVAEAFGQRHFNKAMYKVTYGYDAADDAVAAAFGNMSDFSIVDAASLESYGTYRDAMIVINKNRAGEIFDNAAQVGKTAEYKCEHWLNLSQSAYKDAQAQLAKGDLKTAQALFSASEAFAEEGGRQFVKQYDRIVVQKLGVLCENGVEPALGTFAKAAEVVRELGIGKSGGKGLTTVECDVVLQDGLGSNMKQVFHQLNEWTVELDRLLQQTKK